MYVYFKLESINQDSLNLKAIFFQLGISPCFQFHPSPKSLGWLIFITMYMEGGTEKVTNTSALHTTSIYTVCSIQQGV